MDRVAKSTVLSIEMSSKASSGMVEYRVSSCNEISSASDLGDILGDQMKNVKNSQKQLKNSQILERVKQNWEK